MTEIVSPTQGSGPLYGFALIFDGIGESVDPDSPDAVRIDGRVLDGNGDPCGFPDVFVEFYSRDQFARAQADEAGDWHVVMRKPDTVTLPDGREQAPYLDVVVFVHPVLQQFQTRLYFPDEARRNASDPVLGELDPAARATLIAQSADRGLRFEIRLQAGEHETVFLDYQAG